MTKYFLNFMVLKLATGPLQENTRVHLPIVSRQPGHAAHSRWPIASSPVLLWARGSAANGQAVIPARTHLPPELKIAQE
jgi:hypothetical protein